MFRRFIVYHKEKLKEFKVIDIVTQPDYHSPSYIGIDETTGDIKMLDAQDLKFVRWVDSSSQDILHEIRFGFESLCCAVSCTGTDGVVNMKNKPKTLTEKVMVWLFNLFMSNKYVVIRKDKE